MTNSPSHAQLQEQIHMLQEDLSRQKRFKEISKTLFKISNAINTASDLDELYASLRSALSAIIDTSNFFIARYRPGDDSVNFPYCIDSVDDCYPQVIEISKTESLTAQVIRTRQPVMVTKKEVLDQREKSHRKLPACTPSEIWLGVPLQTSGQLIGVMAVQSYTNAALYDRTDLDVMVSVADQVALAIERKQTEQEREELVTELRKALDEVKTLQGFLPICANCKKIRDDTGYWQRIESYIQAHSNAQFSHGICPECAQELYPDLGLND